MSKEIRCTNCGTLNLDNRDKCRICGHPLHRNEGEVLRCPECGSTVTQPGSERCIACGWEFKQHGPAPAPLETAVPAKECETTSEASLHTVRSFNVELAVIFMMLAGGLGIMHAVLAAIPSTSHAILSNYDKVIPAGKALNDILQNHIEISVLMFAFGALSIGLSLTAMKRSSYPGAIAGSVFGILSIGFLFGAFFGLMALILLALSRREFLLECT